MIIFQVIAADNSFTVHLEQKHGIPNGLLKAIMMVESKGCPYAVYHKGKSFLFKDKKNAIKYVNQSWEKGGRNINVGCMQINLQYHKKHKTTENWFDPYQNTEYAAKFLANLKKRFGSWKHAVEYYHAGEKHRYYKPYIRKVNRYLRNPL